MAFQQPLSLKPNDKVAIISPSSGMPFLFPWVYEQGLDRLKQIFQLEPIEFPTARKSPEYLSQNPQWLMNLSLDLRKFYALDCKKPTKTWLNQNI